MRKKVTSVALGLLGLIYVLGLLGWPLRWKFEREAASRIGLNAGELEAQLGPGYSGGCYNRSVCIAWSRDHDCHFGYRLDDRSGRAAEYGATPTCKSSLVPMLRPPVMWVIDRAEFQPNDQG